MIKALVLIPMIVLIAAAAQSETVKMTWKQPAPDLPSMDRWNVYYGITAETPNLLTTISYTGQTTFETAVNIPPPAGTPGQKVKYYFAIEPISKNGNVADKTMGKTSTGLDYLELIVPYQDVGQAFEVIIELITVPIPQAKGQVTRDLKAIPK